MIFFDDRSQEEIPVYEPVDEEEIFDLDFDVESIYEVVSEYETDSEEDSDM